MARSIIWPTAPAAEAPPPADAGPFAGIDLDGVAAALGPELSRLAGFRIGARTGGKPATQAMLRICRIRLKAGDAVRAIDVDLPAQATACLMERMFGASPSQSAAAPVDALVSLPPGSACWATLCRHISRALGRAFEANGVQLGGGPLLPPRAVLAEAQRSEPADTILALDLDGTPAALALTAEPMPVAVAPAPATPDAQQWRARAQARALDLELPVTLRLAETRVALATVAPLRAGDILPLERPHALDLLVEGRRIGRLPAASFLPTEPDRTDP